MSLETLWRWRVAIMAAGVGLLAAMVRVVNLANPQKLVFDEVYYARGAYSMVVQGYEGDWTGDDQALANGDDSGLLAKGDFVVHPMVGKLIIAVGIKLFGATPYGWRIPGAVLGTITVIMIALIARHLLKSTVWGTMAGVLLALDGEHIVLSRTALLDIYLTFFVVAAFGLLLIDRHRTRHKLFASADAGSSGWGPRLGIRWWRLAAIATFGLATGVKWSGLYFAAAFLVLSVLWDLVDRREAGFARWHVGALVRAVPAALATVILIPLTYVATWWHWLMSEKSYGRQWAVTHPGEGVQWLPESLRSLVRYHEQMYNFHKGVTQEHNYESHPNGWLIQFRPTAFHFEDYVEVDCGASRCVSAIHAVGHPLIWWAMIGALCLVVWRLLLKRDLTGVTVTVGLLAGWLPWLPFAHRTIFTFYSVAMVPFVVLMVVWAARLLAQPDRLGGGWSRRGGLVVGGYVAAVIVIAGFFLPIWTGQPVPYFYWLIHMWSPWWV